MEIDFFARRKHFIDHLADLWRQLPYEMLGRFYVPSQLVRYANEKGILCCIAEGEKENPLNCTPPSNGNPLLTCAYGDMEKAWRNDKGNNAPERLWIMMEHGVGLTFGTAGYAGGLGLRKMVDLFLAPNEYIAQKTESVLDTHQVVIGTPKLDCWAEHYEAEMSREKHIEAEVEECTIAISFHWNGSHVAPEAGCAFEYYKGVLPEIAKKFRLIGHGHPKAIEKYREFYDSIGIKTIENFEDVMEKADVYVCDASSTLYEFLVTGKPVIILNAPWFRKNVHHGIRFWDYTDIGRQVNYPSHLANAITETIVHPSRYREQTKKAVRDLYPYLGSSTQRASEAIVKFMNAHENKEKSLKTPEYKELIALLSGANNSTKGISNAEIEHLSWLGSQVPENSVAVEIGSHRGKSTCAIACGMRYVGKKNPIYAVDVWNTSDTTFEHYRSDETWEIFQRQVLSLNIGNINPVKLSSSKAATRFAANEKHPQIGLLFIDASHKAKDVLRDYQLWHKWIVPGGYIAFHDFGTRFPGVDEAVRLAKESGMFEEGFVCDRIWSAKRKG